MCEGPRTCDSGEAVRREELFSKNGVATETPPPPPHPLPVGGDDGGMMEKENTKTRTQKNMTSSILMEPFITSDASLFRPAESEA